MDRHQTTRLTLRQWQASDYAPFAALNADPEVMRYFPATRSREESHTMANKCHEIIKAQGWGFWAVEEKITQKFIGFVGLNRPDASLPCSPCIEVGWRLAREFWGKGYATEAARAALDAGFVTFGFAEIVSFTALPNQRSIAVMERLGMERDAETFEHPALPEGSPLKTHCLYRLSKRQWQKQPLF